MIVDIEEFLSIRNHLPLVDARSEREFARGHIRSAFNIPLLNNEERAIVGTTYKRQGQEEAIKIGFRLVGPRLEEMVEEAKQIGNDLLVYCWRGGMRSANFCQFMNMAKIKTRQLKGGYKTYRQYATESFKKPLRLCTLTGYTGSGKTEILRALSGAGEQILDLEMLAHHKGSVFGGLTMPPQPTTEQFQNELFEELTKLNHSKRVWIEDESVAIGKIFLPEDFWNQMTASALVEVGVSKEVRTARLVSEYGNADQEKFLEAMTKISKKLGGQHYKAAKEKLLGGDMSSVIEVLLTYYDKAYRNGLDKKKKRIKLYSPWNGTDVHVYVRQLIKEVNALPIFA